MDSVFRSTNCPCMFCSSVPTEEDSTEMYTVHAVFSSANCACVFCSSVRTKCASTVTYTVDPVLVVPTVRACSAVQYVPSEPPL